MEQRAAGRWIRKDMQTEEKPGEVPERAKPSGETRPEWGWVEPCVWTERMLEALENGVKGGKWFSLGIVKLTCCKEYRPYSSKGDTILHAHTTPCQTWNA